jgi:hypothetical protein
MKANNLSKTKKGTLVKEEKKHEALNSKSANVELSQRIDRLNTLLANQISFPRVFLRGVVGGLGSALGATIVMGILVGLIAWLLVSLVEVPVVGDFINKEYVTEQFNTL